MTDIIYRGKDDSGSGLIPRTNPDGTYDVEFNQ